MPMTDDDETGTRKLQFLDRVSCNLALSFSGIPDSGARLNIFCFGTSFSDQFLERLSQWLQSEVVEL